MRARAALAAIAAATVVAAPRATQLPLEPLKDAGLGVTPAYEGWFRRPDGSTYLLVGYFNRNLKQTLDIPVGASNRFEPGEADRGQPTHFLPRRQWGVFTIEVPKDFGERRLTWTIAVNGQTNAIPMGLNPLYEVEPYRDAAQGNTPPVLRFDPAGPSFQGPPLAVAATFQGIVGQPVRLPLWASDDGIVDPDRKAPAAPVLLRWTKYRGPGEATFAEAAPKVAGGGRAATSATFSEPGEYLLRAQANDVSGEGGGGFQCCWTNALVRVQISN